MAALTDAEIRAALPAESRQKIDSAFEALSQSLPSDKERMILYRVAHTLKLQPTDTVFSIMSALHMYSKLYDQIPEKILGTLKTAKETADTIILQSAYEAQVNLTHAVKTAAADVASATATKAAFKWVAVGLVIASIFTIISGWSGYINGKDAGLAEGYAKAKDETAAVAWANTPEGRLARRLADAGGLALVAECKGDGWKIKKNADGALVCYPFYFKDQVTGWRIGNKK